MFRQLHRDGTYEFFVYAPLTRRKDGGPKPPFPDAPRRMSTVYYFWWSFLRMSEEYVLSCKRDGTGPLSALYRDFGDVRDNDFLAWWRRRGVHCFAEPPRTNSVFRVDDLSSFPGIAEDTILVSIPIDRNELETISMVRSLIKESLSARDEGNVRPSRARYRVVGNPHLSSLYKILRVKQAAMRLPKDATRYEVAKMARRLARRDGARIFVKDEGVEDSTRRAELSNYVTKALKRADRLIENVALGRFPDFSYRTHQAP